MTLLMQWLIKTSEMNLMSWPGFFSRDVLLGGKLLLWGEKMWRISKKKTTNKQTKKPRNLLFGEEIQTLGVKILPPKGPEKNTGHDILSLVQYHEIKLHFMAALSRIIPWKPITELWSSVSSCNLRNHYLQEQ